MRVLYLGIAIYFSLITIMGKPFWSPSYKRAKAQRSKTYRYYHK